MSTRFAIATRDDDAAIRRLLRTPMHGRVAVSFEREPDYFRGANLAGGEDATIVASENGRLVCVGRCTRRECWVNGRAARVGYLAELRLDPAARGRFGILRDGYAFFHEQQRGDPAELYFTSIAADNTRARRLLESGARGLPHYVFLAELETLLVALPPRPGRAGMRVEAATPRRVPEIVRLLNTHRPQLGAVWSEERLRSLASHGLPLERILIALDGDRVVACGALWDQRAFRQTVIRGYSRGLAAARPLIALASRLLGTMPLPRPGSALAHAFLSPLAFVSGAEDRAPEFIEACSPFAAAAGVRFLTVGLPAGDPRLTALRRRFATRAWRSRLYRVEWPGGERLEIGGGTILPEVALL